MLSYDYLSLNISAVLLVGGGIFFAFWLAKLLRTCLSIITISIGLHNDTGIHINDYTSEEVTHGLVPTASEFSQILREFKTKRFPPRRLKTSIAFASIYKNSFKFIGDSSLFGVEFTIDCSKSVYINLFWNVAYDDIYKFTDINQIENDNTNSTIFKKDKQQYSKLQDILTKDNKLPIIDNNNNNISLNTIELLTKYSSKTSSILINEGLQQKFILDKSFWISYNDIKNEDQETFPLVIIISLNGDNNTNNTDNSIIFSIIESIEKQDIIDNDEDNDEDNNEDDNEDDNNSLFSLKTDSFRQFLLTNSQFYELQDVYGLDEEEEECVICLTDPRDTTIVPCNHFCVCYDCFGKIQTCPICRAKIEGLLRFIEEEQEENNEDNVQIEEKTSLQEAEIEIVN